MLKTGNVLYDRIKHLESLAERCNEFYDKYTGGCLPLRACDDFFVYANTQFSYTEENVSWIEEMIDPCVKKVNALKEGVAYMESAMLLLAKADEIFKNYEEYSFVRNQIGKFLKI